LPLKARPQLELAGEGDAIVDGSGSGRIGAARSDELLGSQWHLQGSRSGSTREKHGGVEQHRVGDKLGRKRAVSDVPQVWFMEESSCGHQAGDSAELGLRDAAEIRDILERDWAVERDAG
jgi:hypothetical protein